MFMIAFFQVQEYELILFEQQIKHVSSTTCHTALILAMELAFASGYTLLANPQEAQPCFTAHRVPSYVPRSAVARAPLKLYAP